MGANVHTPIVKVSVTETSITLNATLSIQYIECDFIFFVGVWEWPFGALLRVISNQVLSGAFIALPRLYILRGMRKLFIDS
jgi:hypothetical protein